MKSEFTGDLEKQEVKVSLQNFIDVVQENHELKLASVENRYQKWIDLARAIDAWRVFPRIFISAFIILFFTCTFWFTGLVEPTLMQSNFVIAVWGTGAAWFGLYVNSGSRDKAKKTTIIKEK